MGWSEVKSSIRMLTVVLWRKILLRSIYPVSITLSHFAVLEMPPKPPLGQ